VIDQGYVQVLSGFKGDQGELIPILQKVQGEFGYISEQSIKEVSRFLRISENQIYGVASFYSQFRFTPPGRNSVKVCLGTACHVRGGQLLGTALRNELGIALGETTKDKRFDLQRVACLGCCALAPVVTVNEDIYARMTVLRLKRILDKYE
jgi:NADH:ubiquinone oxidoreductase subunit E